MSELFRSAHVGGLFIAQDQRRHVHQSEPIDQIEIIGEGHKKGRYFGYIFGQNWRENGARIVDDESATSRQFTLVEIKAARKLLEELGVGSLQLLGSVYGEYGNDGAWANLIARSIGANAIVEIEGSELITDFEGYEGYLDGASILTNVQPYRPDANMLHATTLATMSPIEGSARSRFSTEFNLQAEGAGLAIVAETTGNAALLGVNTKIDFI